jgi:hypothetical protein
MSADYYSPGHKPENIKWKAKAKQSFCTPTYLYLFFETAVDVDFTPGNIRCPLTGHPVNDG